MPPVQGTALQQSELPEQIWPYSEQTRPPLPPLPPVPAPPMPPVPPVPPEPPLHVPMVEPGGRMQMLPGQQSPLMLHEPARGTHGPLPQRRTPMLSGTQGVRLQQSAADAHVSPDTRQSSPI